LSLLIAAFPPRISSSVFLSLIFSLFASIHCHTSSMQEIMLLMVCLIISASLFAGVVCIRMARYVVLLHNFHQWSHIECEQQLADHCLLRYPDPGEHRIQVCKAETE
jgi:hypothetical protein